MGRYSATLDRSSQSNTNIRCLPVRDGRDRDEATPRKELGSSGKQNARTREREMGAIHRKRRLHELGLPQMDEILEEQRCMRLFQILRGPRHSLQRKQTDNLLRQKETPGNIERGRVTCSRRAAEEVPGNLQSMSKHRFQTHQETHCRENGRTLTTAL